MLTHTETYEARRGKHHVEVKIMQTDGNLDHGAQVTIDYINSFTSWRGPRFGDSLAECIAELVETVELYHETKAG